MKSLLVLLVAAAVFYFAVVVMRRPDTEDLFNVEPRPHTPHPATIAPLAAPATATSPAEKPAMPPRLARDGRPLAPTSPAGEIIPESFIGHIALNVPDLKLTDREIAALQKAYASTYHKQEQLETSVASATTNDDGSVTILVPALGDGGEAVRRELAELLDRALGPDRGQVFLHRFAAPIDEANDNWGRDAQQITVSWQPDSGMYKIVHSIRPAGPGPGRTSITLHRPGELGRYAMWSGFLPRGR